MTSRLMGQQKVSMIPGLWLAAIAWHACPAMPPEGNHGVILVQHCVIVADIIVNLRGVQKPSNDPPMPP
eukprot:48137-Eustigmatos_ZCMA.PRE.1